MFARVFPSPDILKRCSKINVTIERRIITYGITVRKKELLRIPDGNFCVYRKDVDICFMIELKEIHSPS